MSSDAEIVTWSGARGIYPNLFAVMVGDSAKARKGSSWSRVEALFAPFEDWRKRVQTGLSTGEGLIAAVRDPEIKTKTDKETGEVSRRSIEEGVALMCGPRRDRPSGPIIP
jgi:hypothetical protein